MSKFDVKKFQEVAQNVDARPVLLWEGELKLGLEGRVVLTKKNTFVVEQKKGRDALGNAIWDSVDLGSDATEALSQTLKMILGIK